MIVRFNGSKCHAFTKAIKGHTYKVIDETVTAYKIVVKSLIISEKLWYSKKNFTIVSTTKQSKSIIKDKQMEVKKVKCINKQEYSDLTLNKTYNVLDESKTRYKVKVKNTSFYNETKERWYIKSRFKVVESIESQPKQHSSGKPTVAFKQDKTGAYLTTQDIISLFRGIPLSDKIKSMRLLDDTTKLALMKELMK